MLKFRMEIILLVYKELQRILLSIKSINLKSDL